MSFSQQGKPAVAPADDVPLCVDLDGTLIRTDLLVESALKLAKEAPMTALTMPLWLMHGKAHLKAQIAARVDLRVDLLPYNDQVVDYAAAARQAGRQVVLATASNQKYGAQVASHLGIFDALHASDEKENLSAAAKAEKLEGLYGSGGFDYVANAAKDLAVWERARQAVVVDPEPGVVRELARRGRKHEVLTQRGALLGPTLRALRPHQWLKNVLVFLPLLTAHLYSDVGAVMASMLAFTAFSLVAAAGYLFNDLLDLDADRQHPRKRARPFASGEVPLALGLALVPMLVVVALVLGAVLPPAFIGVLGLYLLVTLAYSFFLKRRPTVDVLVLAGLYTVRVIGGTEALALDLSFWLLAFSMFLFTSLAYVKRFAELKAVEVKGKDMAVGRGYIIEDLGLIRSLGTAAGYGSVLVLALYVNSAEIQAMYTHPELMWFVCVLLLYWIGRVWLLADRGLMHDDPLVFALEDRLSQLNLLAAVAIVWLAV